MSKLSKEVSAQRANNLQESEIEESIIEYKEKKSLKCQGIIAFRSSD